MTFHIITIFPDIFSSYFSESIIKRALKNKIIDIKIHNLRDWTSDKHKTATPDIARRSRGGRVDDTPYGGGAGMVMKVEPIAKALQALKSEIRNPKSETNSKVQNPKSKIILLSAKGKRWNQQLAKKYSKLDNIILICGRYEGVDERVKNFVDEEISIGDYVLTGGEIPAMAIVDSLARLLPGALGNAESAKFESHAVKGELEYPQYTRPEVFHITQNMEHKTWNTKHGTQNKKGAIKSAPIVKGGWGGLKIQNSKFKIQNSISLRVPKILLSGNHKKIEEWRKKHIKHRV